ncbi:MAG: NAD(P)-dependent oxidoreductase [Actinobacteria bacterium]|nr:MAG: NAD(P)-dependent oxidoreductase [Actinomycetota bacterium]
MSVVGSRVAVLGATGHVGKCLSAALLGDGTHDVTTVARDSVALARFLAAVPGGAAARRSSFEEFPGCEFDVVLNCVGVGNPESIIALGAEVFDLTERFDRMVMEYLGRHPESMCVSISSGAIYGEFSAPGDGTTPGLADRASLTPREYYGQAKLASELRHREASDQHIVDLRLFGFFSRYADVQARSLMGDIVRAVSRRDVVTVTADDVIRDYVDPDDLAELLRCVMRATPCNGVFDVYSAAPVGKFALLDAFAERYGISYTVEQAPDVPEATGDKPMYYSTDRGAATIGYEPRWTSLEALFRATDALVPGAS